MKKVFFKNKVFLLVILILIIAEPALASVLNFWLQKLFASAQLGADKLLVLRLLTAGFLLWMTKRIISFSSSVFKSKYICCCREDVKRALFKSIMRTNVSALNDKTSSGDYISVFTNDINILETRFFVQIISLVSNVLSVLILGSSFLALNKKIALAIFAFGLLTMFIPSVFSKKLNSKNLAYSDCVSRFTQTLKEFMVAYPTIKNYSIETAVLRKFEYLNKDTESTKYGSDYELNLANAIGSLLSWFMQFIAVGVGLMLVIKGEIVVGTVVAAQGFAGDLAMPLQSIVSNFNSICSVKKVVSKLEKMCEFHENEGLGIENNESFDEGEDLSFFQKDNVIVQFDRFYLPKNGRMIVSDFSFKFEQGKKYLIIGENGSGKSTLFKALKKWHTDYIGNIYVSGADIKTLDNVTLSRYVSYMNENVSLFMGTVKSNITLFNRYFYNRSYLTKTLNNANIKLNLMQYVFDEGKNISSGEMRKIEIARGLFMDVPVLVFDEVVSTLDIKTAFEIEKLALDFKDKTVIFISHNFSGKLIERYDEILLMHEGHLVAHGTYKHLMETCPQFKELCEIKFG